MGSFTLTGMGSPTCLPSDLQTATGSHFGQRHSVVWGVLGLVAKGLKRKRRGVGSLTLSGRDGLACSPWGFRSSPKSKFAQRLRESVPLRESPEKFLENLERVQS